MVEGHNCESYLHPEHCQLADQRKVWLGMDLLALARQERKRKVMSKCHLIDYLWNTQTLSAGDGTW